MPAERTGELVQGQVERAELVVGESLSNVAPLGHTIITVRSLIKVQIIIRSHGLDNE